MAHQQLPPQTQQQRQQQLTSTTTTPYYSDKVTMDKVVEGDGKNVPHKGSLVTVHYTAYYPVIDERNPHTILQKKWDSTIDRGNRPFRFRVESGEVIKGWDHGIVQMSKGERSRMTIPPSLAYGSKGFRHLVPPNTQIIFEVDLMDVKH